ncbi:MAG: hypothetical protein SGBAC_007830 [Bacillariaceae sp.]
MKIWSLNKQQQNVSDEDRYVKENNSDDTSTSSTDSEGSSSSQTNTTNSTAVTSTRVYTSPSKALGGILEICDLHNVYSVLSPRKDSATVVIAEGEDEDEGTEVCAKGALKHGRKRGSQAVTVADEDIQATAELEPELSLEEQRAQLLATSKKLLRNRGFSIRQQLLELLKEESATLLQARVRGLSARTLYHEKVAAAKFIQLFYRIRLQRMHEAAYRIQYFLSYNTEYYRNCRIGASIMIQSVVRRTLVQQNMAKQHQSAARLQTAVRRFLACKQWYTVRQGAIAVQAASRGISTRNKLLDMEYEVRKPRRNLPSNDNNKDNKKVPKHEIHEVEYDDDDEDYTVENESDEEDESLVTYQPEEFDDHEDDIPIEELGEEDRHKDGWFNDLLMDIVGDIEDTWKEMTVAEPSEKETGTKKVRKHKSSQR